MTFEAENEDASKIKADKHKSDKANVAKEDSDPKAKWVSRFTDEQLKTPNPETQEWWDIIQQDHEDWMKWKFGDIFGSSSKIQGSVEVQEDRKKVNLRKKKEGGM